MSEIILDVPLPYDVELDIRETVAQEDEADRDKYEELLRSKFQRLANKEAAYRRVFTEALERAKDAGDPEPEVTAARDAYIQDQTARYEARIRAIFRRGRRRFASSRDKAVSRDEKAAKTARPSLERRPEADRQYVVLLGNAERRGNLGDVPLVMSEIRRKLKRYRPPRWSKSTAPIKVLAMSIVSARAGAQTINLRPNKETCAEAVRSNRGPASYMQDRIRRSMDSTFGKSHSPEFWMVIETDGMERFHIHGAVITPNTSDSTSLVDAALRQAGGVWEKGLGSQYQQVSRSLDHPYVWAGYVCKHLNVAKVRIERKLFASTLGIRRMAQDDWGTIRTTLPRC